MKIFSKIFFLVICSLFGNVFGFEFNCRSVYNPNDVTLGLQKAFNSGAERIIVPYMGPETKWISGPLLLNSLSNVEIIFEKGVILEAKSGEFEDRITSFITIKECRNIKIKGYSSVIKMHKKEYGKGEWRHGISILSSDTIIVQGVLISSTGGDGIYIGTAKNTGINCSDILIQDVVADQNSRNGISVISCKNLLIENCIIKNTGRNNSMYNAANGPWAGIDLEPNFLNEILENITIINCRIMDNKGAGLLFAFGCQLTTVNIVNNIIQDNWCGIHLVGKLRGENGKIQISNNSIIGKHSYGLYFLNWNITDILVSIEKCSIDNREISIPVKFEIIDKNQNISGYGNVSFQNMDFKNFKGDCLIYLEGGDSLRYYENISVNDALISYDPELNESIDRVSIYSLYSDRSVSGDNIFCIVNNESLSIQVSPNPFIDHFVINTNSQNLLDVRLYSMEGRLMYYESLRDGDFVQCKQLIVGPYIISVKDWINKRVAQTKIVKASNK